MPEWFPKGQNLVILLADRAQSPEAQGTKSRNVRNRGCSSKPAGRHDRGEIVVETVVIVEQFLKTGKGLAAKASDCRQGGWRIVLLLL
jgi:hypothetical protein